MPEYIHGRTDSREVARLEKQAYFAAPFILSGFDASPGMRVLDLATGVGAMAGQLLQHYPGIVLVGLDLQRHQLEQAFAHHPGPSYLQATGSRMPFSDHTFDRVHCSWLLEHVPDPAPVLREVHRVLKPGGYCQFTEVDNATFLTEPAIPEVLEVMDALNRAQQKGGGDPFIGQRLEQLMKDAGFSEVDLRYGELFGDARSPALFDGFVAEFAEIFESLDEALGPQMGPKLARAAARLRELPSLPGARMYYRSTIGRGTR